ncbi:unnamed protein product [Paramecium sonneborni]|uniref:Uncharacterized protein n=1 Tax=Paramecium sonneborni TaxID=65129 RepID=A0A8S1PJC0_9CILI|nr:unnamed protein product [Paramecium sonneborni]
MQQNEKGLLMRSIICCSKKIRNKLKYLTREFLDFKRYLTYLIREGDLEKLKHLETIWLQYKTNEISAYVQSFHWQRKFCQCKFY